MNLDAGPYAAVQVPEDQFVVASGRMLSACLLAGLAVQDAEDLCQDIWEWLLNSDNLAMATLAPWLGAVVANFLLRFLSGVGRSPACSGKKQTPAASPRKVS